MNKKDIILNAANTILFGDAYQGLYDVIHQLHNLYASINNIRATDITDGDIYQPSGKAISPIKAAHCLLEVDRSRKFIRGIYKAILHLQSVYPNKRINILYAGTGPYATLVTPLTAIFSAQQISFYFIDINETSLTAVKQLYQDLGLIPYVQEFIKADASTYQVTAASDIHMMISETMQNALKREPQVAIMNNLIPQLPPGGVFIPEEISIDAVLIDPGAETKSFFVEGAKAERVYLGNIYKVGRHINKIYGAISLPLPADRIYKQLSLLTTIKVFNDEVLADYSCSLTLPYKLMDIDFSTANEVTFEYVLDSNPHFKYELSQLERA